MPDGDGRKMGISTRSLASPLHVLLVIGFNTRILKIRNILSYHLIVLLHAEIFLVRCQMSRAETSIYIMD